MDEKDKKIADLQRLCERAWMEISENYDKLTVSDGLDTYGPASLLRALEKVKDGKEYKDLRKINEILIRKYTDMDIWQKYNQLLILTKKMYDLLEELDSVEADALLKEFDDLMGE